MLKPFSMIFFVLVMVWAGSILVTSSPQARIDRGCAPATLADKILVAVVQVIHEPFAEDAHEMMLHFEYGCRFTLWKVFYEDGNAHRGSKNSGNASKSSTQKNQEKELTEIYVAPASPSK